MKASLRVVAVLSAASFALAAASADGGGTRFLPPAESPAVSVALEGDSRPAASKMDTSDALDGEALLGADSKMEDSGAPEVAEADVGLEPVEAPLPSSGMAALGRENAPILNEPTPGSAAPNSGSGANTPATNAPTRISPTPQENTPVEIVVGPRPGPAPSVTTIVTTAPSTTPARSATTMTTIYISTPAPPATTTRTATPATSTTTAATSVEPVPGKEPEPTTTTATTTTTPAPECVEHPGIPYKLRWSAQGRGFFDAFDFLTTDFNNGATQFVGRQEAAKLRVAEAFDTHAILRAGPRSPRRFKRASAKIVSKRSWTYFLATIKLTHVPWGCGVWPALWTNAPAARWPEGGELDIIEHVHDSVGQTSLHTGRNNRCKLQPGLLLKPGCPPMPDLNNMGYDCYTSYPKSLGCAANALPVYNGLMWALNPSVVAVEWTPSYIKVFRIPEGELPADLAGDDPKPDGWDKWIIAYYPLAASERLNPGSCPRPEKVLQPQQLVLNIGFCGDWASKVWDLAGSCVNRVGPRYPEECRPVDPLHESDPGHDCCTQFIWDEDGSYGTEDYLRTNAFFNISWAKVYQWAGWPR